MKENKIKTYALALFAMLLWGSAFPALKISYQNFNILANDYASKMLLAGVRFFLAGFLVFIYILIFDRKLIKQFKPNFKFLLILGILNTTINYLFFYIGVGNTSGVKSAILQSSSTFLTVLFAHFMLSEKINKRTGFALLLGLLGIIASNIGKGFDLSFTLQGEGFIFITGITSALATILVKRSGKEISSLVMTSGQMMLGSILLLIVGFVGKSPDITINTKGILVLLYSSIISSLAYAIWYYLLSRNPASEITFLRLFIPIFGTVLSAIVLGESLTYYILFGLFLVVLGVYFINKKPATTNR
ncbi:MAG: DMT family transporter [Tissierellia bacterium]|nr:DMT family transporter [Tissierellia bacterium]